MSKLLNVEALITQYHGNTDYAKTRYKSGTHRGLDVNPINRHYIPEDDYDWNAYSPMGGLVMHAGWDDVYGYSVIVYNEDMRSSLHFAHLQETAVQTGHYIDADTFIGIIGDTGNSDARHLHIGYIPMLPYGNRLFDDASNPYNGCLDPLGFLISLGVNI